MTRDPGARITHGWPVLYPLPSLDGSITAVLPCQSMVRLATPGLALALSTSMRTLGSEVAGGRWGQVTRSVAVRGSRWQPMTLLYSSAVRLIGSGARGRKPQIKSLTGGRSEGFIAVHRAGVHAGELQLVCCQRNP